MSMSTMLVDAKLAEDMWAPMSASMCSRNIPLPPLFSNIVIA